MPTGPSITVGPLPGFLVPESRQPNQKAARPSIPGQAQGEAFFGPAIGFGAQNGSAAIVSLPTELI